LTTVRSRRLPRRRRRTNRCRRRRPRRRCRRRSRPCRRRNHGGCRGRRRSRHLRRNGRSRWSRRYRSSRSRWSCRPGNWRSRRSGHRRCGRRDRSCRRFHCNARSGCRSNRRRWSRRPHPRSASRRFFSGSVRLGSRFRRSLRLRLSQNVLANFLRNILWDRARVRLLLRDAIPGQKVNDRLRFDLKLPRQLINSNLVCFVHASYGPFHGQKLNRNCISLLGRVQSQLAA